MIPFFRRLYWRFYGNRKLGRAFARLTLPQLNLVEARIHERGQETPAMEALFEELRVKKQKALAFGEST